MLCHDCFFRLSHPILMFCYVLMLEIRVMWTCTWVRLDIRTESIVEVHGLPVAADVPEALCTRSVVIVPVLAKNVVRASDRLRHGVPCSRKRERPLLHVCSRDYNGGDVATPPPPFSVRFYSPSKSVCVFVCFTVQISVVLFLKRAIHLNVIYYCGYLFNQW